MKIFTNINENIPKNCVVTVGIFDGVHSGHKYILQNLIERAKKLDTEELLITLCPHPSIFFNNPIKLINTFDEKVSLLKDLGIRNLLVLDFNSELANMSNEDFTINILKNRLNALEVLMGFNNSFGNKEKESANLKELGISLRVADKYELKKYANINSSEIRSLLNNGEVEKASELLTYDYFLSGKIISGYQIGRKIGFPTANVSKIDENKLIPQNGVYIIEVLLDDTWFPAMLNIGTRPSFDGTELSVEFHILDYEADLYNQSIKLKFKKRIRAEKKFDNVNSLKMQLNADEETTRQYFGM